MSFFKKIGSALKKALPVASGLLSFLPGGQLLGGVGSAISSLWGGSSAQAAEARSPSWSGDTGLDGGGGDAVPWYSQVGKMVGDVFRLPGATVQGSASPSFLELAGKFAPAVGALASGGLAAYGQREANVANAEMAQKQMDFQERMSNSQWQRGVADMQKAGLNPMLAYSQGGASSPSGATASMASEAGAGVSSASQALGTIQNAQLQQSSIALQMEQVLRTAAEAEYFRANTAQSDAKTAQIRAETADQFPALRKLWASQGGSADASAGLARQQERTERHTTGLRETQSKLEGLKVPGAENEANRQRLNEWWITHNVPEYVATARQAAGAVADLGNMVGRFLPHRQIMDIFEQGSKGWKHTRGSRTSGVTGGF